MELGIKILLFESGRKYREYGVEKVIGESGKIVDFAKFNLVFLDYRFFILG